MWKEEGEEQDQHINWSNGIAWYRNLLVGMEGDGKT